MHLEDFLKEDWMKKTDIRLSNLDEVSVIKKLIVDAYTPIEAILGRKPRGMKETEEKVKERIANKTIYSVLYEGKLIGTFTLKYNEKYELMEVQKIAITTEMQNKGFGSYIMESTEHLVREMDHKKIMIQTYEDHKLLVDFYLHRGYKTFHQTDRWGNIVLMMEKKLWRED
ncbi:MAG: GNAT family N-acetyltransferase [Candidatus Heimdallarchaeota archaeon]